MVALDLERETAICSDRVVAMDSDGGAVKEAVIDSDQVHVTATDSDVAAARDSDRAAEAVSDWAAAIDSVAVKWDIAGIIPNVTDSEVRGTSGLVTEA